MKAIDQIKIYNQAIHGPWLVYASEIGKFHAERRAGRHYDLSEAHQNYEAAIAAPLNALNTTKE